MTLGRLFMDDTIVYGSPVIEAYNLESKSARSPRIILSSDVMQMVNNHMTYYADRYDSPQNRFILKDFDGFYFINYLDGINKHEQNAVTIDWQGVGQHKCYIVSRLSEFTDTEHVFQKYLWLGGYHNWLIRRYDNLAGYSSEYLIDAALFHTPPTYIIPSPEHPGFERDL